jgi:hypothetical protein
MMKYQCFHGNLGCLLTLSLSRRQQLGSDILTLCLSLESDVKDLRKGSNTGREEGGISQGNSIEGL